VGFDVKTLAGSYRGTTYDATWKDNAVAFISILACKENQTIKAVKNRTKITKKLFNWVVNKML